MANALDICRTPVARLALTSFWFFSWLAYRSRERVRAGRGL